MSQVTGALTGQQDCGLQKGQSIHVQMTSFLLGNTLDHINKEAKVAFATGHPAETISFF